MVQRKVNGSRRLTGDLDELVVGGGILCGNKLRTTRTLGEASLRREDDKNGMLRKNQPSSSRT